MSEQTRIECRVCRFWRKRQMTDFRYQAWPNRLMGRTHSPNPWRLTGWHYWGWLDVCVGAPHTWRKWYGFRRPQRKHLGWWTFHFGPLYCVWKLAYWRRKRARGEQR